MGGQDLYSDPLRDLATFSETFESTTPAGKIRRWATFRVCLSRVLSVMQHGHPYIASSSINSFTSSAFGRATCNNNDWWRSICRVRIYFKACRIDCGVAAESRSENEALEYQQSVEAVPGRFKDRVRSIVLHSSSRITAQTPRPDHDLRLDHRQRPWRSSSVVHGVWIAGVELHTCRRDAGTVDSSC